MDGQQQGFNRIDASDKGRYTDANRSGACLATRQASAEACATRLTNVQTLLGDKGPSTESRVAPFNEHAQYHRREHAKHRHCPLWSLNTDHCPFRAIHHLYIQWNTKEFDATNQNDANWMR